MTYTALLPHGPRLAVAESDDLFHWRRLGLATFEPYHGIAFDGIDDKDASVFPVAVPDPAGQPALALLHRPLFPGTRPEEKARDAASGVRDLYRESIWISYRAMAIERGEPRHLCHFTAHHRLATPVAAWERLKIGGGTPPVLTPHGWLIVYRGVSAMAEPSNNGRRLCYSAGVMVLSTEHPRVIRYRSAEPALTPALPEERSGARRVPHQHRPARRSRPARPLRRLLRDGR